MSGDDLLSPGYEPSDEQRFVAEPSKRAARTAFARDRARVLHSAALRRLAATTQVVVAGQADFPRTRLTHTLEVAQVGRELGGALGCDPDLVETACLSHDLGHPPFGHNGESALDEVSQGIGGFEGNAQSLRVLTRLEAKTVDPVDGRSVGLNLTRAALDAAGKYPWRRHAGGRKFGVYADDLAVFTWVRAAAPGERRCFEAQVMDWADDVAYSVHDVEDAVHGGHLDLRALTSSGERAGLLRLAQSWYAPDTDPGRLSYALDRLLALRCWPASYDGSMPALAALKNLTSELIGRFCSAAEVATREAYGGGRLTRYAANLVVPDDVRDEVAVMKSVAARYVMLRDGAEEIYADQRVLLAELVATLVLRGGRDLQTWIRPSFDAAESDAGRMRVIIDQVASLTDTSAVAWHRTLCA